MKLNLVAKEYVDNKQMIFLYDQTELPDVEKYLGRTMYFSNKADININGVIIPAWSFIFFPYIKIGDFTGLSIYPNASSAFIIGHTNDGYYAKRII